MYFKNFKRTLVRATSGMHVIAFKPKEIIEVASCHEEMCLSNGLVPCQKDGTPGELDGDFETRVENEKLEQEEAELQADIEASNESVEKAELMRAATEKAEREAREKRSAAAAKGKATKEKNKLKKAEAAAKKIADAAK